MTTEELNQIDDSSDVDGEVIAPESTEPEDRGDNLPEPAAEEAPEPEHVEEHEDERQKKGGGMIPHARFSEVNEQRKEAQRLAELERQRADALEAELQALRTNKPPAATPAPAFGEDAKEREYADALMEGELEKASQIRREINRELRKQAAQDAITYQQQAEAERQLMTVAKQAEKDYPYLNTPEGAEVLEMIILSRDQRARKGIPLHQALADAVSAIAPRFAPNETPSSGLQNTKQKVDTRTAQAIARGVSASASQPPAVQAGIGNRATSSMLDVSDMTDDQFNALSAAEKAKLRGDAM